jgi:hypothetical protein
MLCALQTKLEKEVVYYLNNIFFLLGELCILNQGIKIAARSISSKKDLTVLGFCLLICVCMFLRIILNSFHSVFIVLVSVHLSR